MQFRAVLSTLQFSSHPEAAELFARVPLRSTADLYHGTRKAGIYCLLLPALAVVLVLQGFLLDDPWRALLLALPALVALPVVSLLPGLVGAYLPLSHQAGQGEQAQRQSGMVLGGMLVMGEILGVSYLADILGVLLPFLCLEALVAVGFYPLFKSSIRARPFPVV